MLKFQAMGDGNCLYNAEAVLLVRSFLDKKLDPLFNNKNYLKEFHQLLTIFQANGLITVAKNPTKTAVTTGFKRLIAHFTVDDQIDWHELQTQVAVALREYVQHAIITDLAVQASVKTELARAFDQCIDMAYLNNHEMHNTLPESIELEAINGAHFEGMDFIVNKIKEVLENDEFHTPELKKIALSDWFFNGEAIGFGEYLQGENGIGIAAIHSGEIELKVLSARFGIIHKTHMAGSIDNELAASYYDAFKSPEEARKVAKNAVIFAFEKTPDHWNCLLNDTPENRAWMAPYEAQLKQNECDKILIEYGTFDAHRVSLNLTAEEYRQMYAISDKQYNDSVLSDKMMAKHLSNESLKPESPAKLSSTNNQKVTGSKDYWKQVLTSAAVIAVFFHCFVLPILQSGLIGITMPHLSLLGVCGLLGMSILAGVALVDKMEATSQKQQSNGHGVVSQQATSKPVSKVIGLLEQNAPTFLVYQNTSAQQQKREQQKAMEGRPTGPRHKLN